MKRKAKAPKNQLRLFNQTQYKHKVPEPINPDLEKWLPAKGYEERYEVSDHGRVRLINDRTFYKAQRNIVKGKKCSGIISHGSKDRRERLSVSKLVYTTFSHNIPTENFIVKHKDGDLHNSHISNLIAIIQQNISGRPLSLKIENKRYGHATVVKRIDKLHWECICDCGTVFTITRAAFKKKKVLYCSAKCPCRPDKDTVNIQSNYSAYKTGAAYRNYTFNISLEFFAEKIKQDCVYCGSQPNPYNGIDRIKNNIGYEEYNCVTCCKNCNYSKLNLDLTEWLNTIERIYNNRENIRKLIK